MHREIKIKDEFFCPECLEKRFESVYNIARKGAQKRKGMTFLSVWHLWVILALVFLVVEIFTAGFAVACFSIGCLAAAVCAALDVSLVYQLLAFAVGSGLAFAVVRPALLKLFFKEQDAVKTNADALIGREGRVSETIEAGGYGRVAVDGDDWKAMSQDGEAIEKGEKVEIVARESVILTVKKL